MRMRRESNYCLRLCRTAVDALIRDRYVMSVLLYACVSV